MGGGIVLGDTAGRTLLSTTLLSTTIKRGAGGDAVEYTSLDLATQLIKVRFCIVYIQGGDGVWSVGTAVGGGLYNHQERSWG